MKVFKDKVSKPSFKLPHKKIEKLPGAGKVRVFVLGPPKGQQDLVSMNPEGGEVFHAPGLALSSAGSYFAAAAQTGSAAGESPFSRRYRVPFSARESAKEADGFFHARYGPPQEAPKPAPAAASASATT